MAISPVSDLILDVARAADPQKASAASRALAAGDGGAGFSAALSQTQGAVDAGGYAYRNGGQQLSQAMSPAKKAAVGVESVLLKSFIDEMLPKDAADVFGSGTAGDVWRSMLSEKIADQVAKSGALKISERLFASHPDLLKPSTVGKLPAPAALAPQLKLKI